MGHFLLHPKLMYMYIRIDFEFGLYFDNFFPIIDESPVQFEVKGKN